MLDPIIVGKTIQRVREEKQSEERIYPQLKEVSENLRWKHFFALRKR